MKEYNNYTQLPDQDKLKEILITQAILDTIMIEEEDSWLRETNNIRDLFSTGLIKSTTKINRRVDFFIP